MTMASLTESPGSEGPWLREGPPGSGKAWASRVPPSYVSNCLNMREPLATFPPTPEQSESVKCVQTNKAHRPKPLPRCSFVGYLMAIPRIAKKRCLQHSSNLIYREHQRWEWDLFLRLGQRHVGMRNQSGRRVPGSSPRPTRSMRR